MDDMTAANKAAYYLKVAERAAAQGKIGRALIALESANHYKKEAQQEQRLH